MFWPDIVQLKEFYASPAGQVAAHIIGRHVRRAWADVRGEKIVGIGFATPFLAPFVDEAERVLALMPAAQGAMYWPPSRPNHCFLSHEAEIPLPDNSINRLLLVHVLENSQHLGALLQEAWRVLAPSGTLLAIAANRHGMWARWHNSPFSYGQPYSTAQLRKLFSESDFTCHEPHTALFMPPTNSPLFHRWAEAMEKIGPWCISGLGGVVMMQAEKQLYAVRGDGIRVPARTRVYVPAPRPAMTFK